MEINDCLGQRANMGGKHPSADKAKGIFVFYGNSVLCIILDVIIVKLIPCVKIYYQTS